MTIRFVAPSDEAIDQVARSICMELGQKNPVFLRPEVCHGLAVHLKVIAAAQVRIANTRADYTNSFTQQSRPQPI